jgi:hypothetical protein
MGAVRRDSKPEIAVPRKASFAVGPASDRVAGWVVRLSIVGVEIESLQPPAIGSEVVVWSELVEGEGEVVMRGRVQWATTTGFAVQFGPLGARDTNIIVRATRRSVA